ncbi:MAG: aspartate 1-decarboxylase [Synergistetes bacterium HGW-Synergistetes-1]|nr:aspartate 1-decarboxylase [Synergistaceae bacterium]PKL04089.1 MAG: aspartate 1-decarboxylase [Synergistetes bacterium HGW-Synergistetes-1]
MILTMLKAKIHRAAVTESNLNYVGSITIDKDLMEASGILEYEKVSVVDIDNGSRLETYVIEGECGSGVICLNGAAARLVHPGDKVIILAYCQVDSEEAESHSPKIVFVGSGNAILEIKGSEEHGEVR